MNQYLIGAALGMYVLGAVGFGVVTLQMASHHDTVADRVLMAASITLWPAACVVVLVWVLRDIVVDAWDARRSE